MTLLLINPNTTASITDLMLGAARRFLGPDVAVRGVTGSFGADYIASRAAYTIAGHAALDAAARHGAGCEGILIACFGEPGIEAVRELVDVPVVGMAEASLHLAGLIGRRTGIVTGGERWGTMLEDHARSRHLDGRLAGIRAIAPSGAEIARDPDAAIGHLRAACLASAEQDGADVVILGGAGLAGLAGRVGEGLPVPVICSFEAGLAGLRAVVALKPRKALLGPFARTPAVGSTGLSQGLAAALAGGAA